MPWWNLPGHSRPDVRPPELPAFRTHRVDRGRCCIIVHDRSRIPLPKIRYDREESLFRIPLHGCRIYCVRGCSHYPLPSDRQCVFSLAGTLGLAVLVIVLFTFYSSIARDLPFWSRFIEMAVLSLGIAAISFLIGMAIRVFLGVTV